jgi:hypothetical protein
MSMGQNPLPDMPQQTLPTMGARRTIAQDPAVDTFSQRFGNWDMEPPLNPELQLLINRTIQQEQEQRRGTMIRPPGSYAIDPLGHRGERRPSGYYMLRSI